MCILILSNLNNSTKLLDVHVYGLNPCGTGRFYFFPNMYFNLIKAFETLSHLPTEKSTFYSLNNGS